MSVPAPVLDGTGYAPWLYLGDIGAENTPCTDCSSGGGGSGNAQLVLYTSGNPLPPSNVNQPAIAYDPTGVLPTVGWDTTLHQWGF